MKPVALKPCAQEIELKLMLLGTDPARLAKRLARVPVLARLHPTHQYLHNVYYDTPEQTLRQQRIALRIRRVGSEVAPQWLQTLKTGGTGNSALSQRGEWEVPVPSAALALEALEASPWSAIDPDGSVFRSLVPAFVTRFERTGWIVRQRDGSVIEVALDLGDIVADDKRCSICELELELLAGPPAALFALAKRIARTLAVLPATKSKAQRGYELAQDRLDAPLHAQLPLLSKHLSLSAVEVLVLREMFAHFTTNLNALCNSDDSEVVHQVRVGWRRFKSALRLFKSALKSNQPPSWQALKVLLIYLGELRDLEVAWTDTLAPLAITYIGTDSERSAAWLAMTQALQQATALKRKSVHRALSEPAVGEALLAMTQWLEELPLHQRSDAAVNKKKLALRRWSRHRIARLHLQLKSTQKDTSNPDYQHRVRIIAKRMRYGIEALGRFLPKQRKQRWYLQATRLQLDLGATRDALQVVDLIGRLEVDYGLVEFLRGVAVGQADSSSM
jgi:inorganic triphosphatase YgiF